MYVGKDEVFDAVTVHLDEVETLAPGMHVLAHERGVRVQAAEVRCNGALAWGVQYHPEYPLHDIAATVRRHGKRLVEEGFFNDESELARLFATSSTRCIASPATRRWPGGMASTRRARQEFARRGDRQLDHASGAADARAARTAE